jgi:isoleucyl-tRNA synthetase
MLYKLNAFTKSVEDHYNNFDFLNIYKELINFVVSDLSAFYLDFAKDVLYIEAENSPARRSMQTVFYQIAVSLTKLITPILPHTAEEIWGFLKEPEDFVQLAEMPAVLDMDDANEIEDDEHKSAWDHFMNLRSHVLKALEEARDAKLIGKAAEAHLDLYVDDETQALLDKLDINVQQILLVSGLDIAKLADAPADALTFDHVAVKVTPAAGEVCERCRLVKEDVGSDSDYPHFCARCAAIVRANYPETATEGFEEK